MSKNGGVEVAKVGEGIVQLSTTIRLKRNKMILEGKRLVESVFTAFYYVAHQCSARHETICLIAQLSGVDFELFGGCRRKLNKQASERTTT